MSRLAFCDMDCMVVCLPTLTVLTILLPLWIVMSYPRNGILSRLYRILDFVAYSSRCSCSLRNSLPLVNIPSASCFEPITPMTKSRVKEWLSDFRRRLSVAAGFPMAVPHSLRHIRFTIPFPSHRTFSFPEYGGPTVFLAHHAQVAPGT